MRKRNRRVGRRKRRQGSWTVAAGSPLPFRPLTRTQAELIVTVFSSSYIASPRKPFPDNAPPFVIQEMRAAAQALTLVQSRYAADLAPCARDLGIHVDGLRWVFWRARHQLPISVRDRLFSYSDEHPTGLVFTIDPRDLVNPTTPRHEMVLVWVYMTASFLVQWRAYEVIGGVVGPLVAYMDQLESEVFSAMEADGLTYDQAHQLVRRAPSKEVLDLIEQFRNRLGYLLPEAE